MATLLEILIDRIIPKDQGAVRSSSPAMKHMQDAGGSYKSTMQQLNGEVNAAVRSFVRLGRQAS